MNNQDNTHNDLKDKPTLNTSMKFDFNAALLGFFEFRTDTSKDFNIDTVKLLVGSVNRENSREKLLQYVKFFVLAEQIEKGIFEFTLTAVAKDNLIPQLAHNIYEDKLNDLCKNLDVNDEYIQNKTLLQSVMHFRIDPFYIAYMSPHQLHPVGWKYELQKRAEKMNIQNNIITSDLYTCHRCGGKKCTTEQVQTRGADEPATIFVTCITCYNVFTD